MVRRFRFFLLELLRAFCVLFVLDLPMSEFNCDAELALLRADRLVTRVAGHEPWSWHVSALDENLQNNTVVYDLDLPMVPDWFEKYEKSRNHALQDNNLQHVDALDRLCLEAHGIDHRRLDVDMLRDFPYEIMCFYADMARGSGDE